MFKSLHDGNETFLGCFEPDGPSNAAFHPLPGQQDSYHLQVPMQAQNF